MLHKHDGESQVLYTSRLKLAKRWHAYVQCMLYLYWWRIELPWSTNRTTRTMLRGGTFVQYTVDCFIGSVNTGFTRLLAINLFPPPPAQLPVNTTIVWRGREIDKWLNATFKSMQHCLPSVPICSVIFTVCVLFQLESRRSQGNANCCGPSYTPIHVNIQVPMAPLENRTQPTLYIKCYFWLGNYASRKPSQPSLQ